MANPGKLVSTGLLIILLFSRSILFASDVPALIPFPQKITWTTNNFKIKDTVALICPVDLNDRTIMELRDFFSSLGSEVKIAGVRSGNKVREEQSLIHVKILPGNKNNEEYLQLKEPESMSRWKGKFYGRNDFLELVDYCHQRHITLVPEFDIPGHSEAGLSEKTEEVPFTDENYYFREPVKVSLKKGWNQVLLKIPQDGTSWKWMFTFVPVEIRSGKVYEAKGLKFKPFRN